MHALYWPRLSLELGEAIMEIHKANLADWLPRLNEDCPAMTTGYSMTGGGGVAHKSTPGGPGTRV